MWQKELTLKMCKKNFKRVKKSKMSLKVFNKRVAKCKKDLTIIKE